MVCLGQPDYSGFLNASFASGVAYGPWLLIPPGAYGIKADALPSHIIYLLHMVSSLLSSEAAFCNL